MKKLTFLTAILLAFSTLAQVPNYVPTNGLVGWWPFNGNANDESGNGNNGTVNGATLTSDRNGLVNKAYYFQNNTIEIPNNAQLGFATNNSFSFGLWVYKNGNQGLMHFIGKRSPNSPYFNWQLAYSSNIYFQSGSGPGITPGVVSSSILTNQSWTYIVGVYNNTNWKLYINGNLDNTNNGNAYMDNPSSLTIGNSGNYEPFIGTIDDIGIWNRALTDCEIKDLYNSQLGSSNTTSSQTQTALDTYTWPVNNQTYTQSGTYSDTLVNAAGCDSIVTLNLTLSYTGINELNASQLVVSPNPTKDNFSISGLELLETITSMEVKDASGKVVKVLNPTTTNFSCVGLKAGVYFLAVTSNKTERVIKIIKE